MRVDRSRPGETRLFGGPVLLRKMRRDIAELIGWIWLAIEVGRVVRSR
jgi:hypothetical protein